MRSMNVILCSRSILSSVASGQPGHLHVQQELQVIVPVLLERPHVPLKTKVPEQPQQASRSDELTEEAVRSLANIEFRNSGRSL